MPVVFVSICFEMSSLLSRIANITVSSVRVGLPPSPGSVAIVVARREAFVCSNDDETPVLLLRLYCAMHN